jgi:hypothetical protein
VFELGDGGDHGAAGGLVAVEQALLGVLAGGMLELGEKFATDTVGDAGLDGRLLVVGDVSPSAASRSGRLRR